MARASTVAVVVPSPATSEVLLATSFTICAPMSSNLSSSSISFATVTPSLVMFGAPNDFSSTTLRPLGPRVTVTASARTRTPANTLFRASSPNFTIFAGMVWLLSRFHDAEDVVLAHDQVLVAVQADFGTRVFPEQNLVACLHGQRQHFSLVAHLPFADRHDLSLLGLLFG